MGGVPVLLWELNTAAEAVNGGDVDVGARNESSLMHEDRLRHGKRARIGGIGACRASGAAVLDKPLPWS